MKSSMEVKLEEKSPEAKNLVKPGDVVFPYVWGYNSGEILVDPIVVFWHEKMRCFYTTAHKPYQRVIVNVLTGGRRALSPNISLVGWANPTSGFGKGLKVFLPDLKFDNPVVQRAALAEKHAIEIDKVFTKSAIGHIVEIAVKPNEKG